MKNYFKILIGILAVVSFSACTDQDDIYKQWVKPGGYIYPEKSTGLVSQIGHSRVVLRWAAPLDPSVVKGIITWSNGDESREIYYADYAGQDSIRISIDGLKEKSYTFTITNYDKDGNKSVASEVTAAPYDQIWLATHQERKVSFAEMSGTDAVVTMGYGTNEMIATRFRYVTNEGETVVTENAADIYTTSFKLPNAKPQSRFEYASAYCPAEGADTVWNNWVKYVNPIAAKLDPSDFEVTVNGGNGTQYRIFDGIVANDFNHCWYYNGWADNAAPAVLQIDMKKDSYHICRLKVFNFASMGYRLLRHGVVFYGNAPFDMSPDPSYHIPFDAKDTFGGPTIEHTKIYEAPTYIDAVATTPMMFYNGTANATYNYGDPINARYIAFVLLDRRVGPSTKYCRTGIQEVEIYGFDTAAE